MAKRKICVVTGSRADYGLLFWLMKEVGADPELTLQLVVTGTHLAPKYGDTYTVIKEDGFRIDARVDIEVGDDTAVGISRSMGLAVIGLSEAFENLRPDIVVLLGDRYEILAAAEAAMIARIPIAHIHGGEITEGALDDAMRHATTKLAAMHFTAADRYRLRVIQLGEAPERVFNVGAPGLDNIEKLDLLDRSGLEKELAIPPCHPFFLVTYHPATAGIEDSVLEAEAMLTTFDRFPNYWIVMTGVNADPGHKRIATLLNGFADAGKGRVSLHASLGQLRYLSAMKHAAAVIGNSSSGIIEAPVLGVPTVNIGDRQKGRLRAPSIIDCAGIADEIAAAIERTLEPESRAGLENMVLPYGAGGASKKIKGHLKAANLEALARKSFFDIPLEKAAS